MHHNHHSHGHTVIGEHAAPGVDHEAHRSALHHPHPQNSAHHVSVAGGKPSNYSMFPSPVPASPLKESPLSQYPPFQPHGRVEGCGDPHAVKGMYLYGSDNSASHSQQVRVLARGDVSTAAVHCPYYNQLSYQPVTDQTNTLAPMHGVHLYHNPDCVDAMKARMVLEEKGVTWNSEIVSGFNMDQYEPEYMSMNPRGTVPTLTVDNRVTTDTRNILNYVNHTFPGPNLVPSNEAEREVMEHFVDLADRQNVEALAFGKIAGVKKRTYAPPYTKRRKVIKTQQAKHAQNRHLAEAYKQKEASLHYQEDIVSSPAKMGHVFSNTQHMLAECENQLTNGPFAYGGWLASDQFTLADIHFICFLRFLDALGLKRIFGTNTTRYYTQGKTRNSYVSAGDEWTSAYGRATKQYVPIAVKQSKKNKKCLALTAGGLAVLGLLSMLFFGGLTALWHHRRHKDDHLDEEVHGNLKSSEQNYIVDSKSKNTKSDVDVYHDSDLDEHDEKNKVGGFAKLLLLLFFLLLLIPLFLWCCGCIKCKKKSGRSRPRKAVVAQKARSGSHKSVSSSDLPKKAKSISSSDLPKKVKSISSSDFSKKAKKRRSRSSSDMKH